MCFLHPWNACYCSEVLNPFLIHCCLFDWCGLGLYFPPLLDTVVFLLLVGSLFAEFFESFSLISWSSLPGLLLVPPEAVGGIVGGSALLAADVVGTLADSGRYIPGNIARSFLGWIKPFLSLCDFRRVSKCLLLLFSDSEWSNKELSSSTSIPAKP